MRSVIAFTLLGVLSGCVGYPHTAAVQPQPAPTWETIELTKEIEEARKEVVRKTLRDPESARFSDLYAAKRIDGSGGIAMCGFVNAKNGYGGSVGRQSE